MIARPSQESSAAAPETRYHYDYIWIVSVIAALGGLLFGYDWVVIGAAGTFWIYAAICLGGFIYILRSLPETKQKSLEKIEKSWSTPEAQRCRGARLA
jgi:hypothetical protein